MNRDRLIHLLGNQFATKCRHAGYRVHVTWGGRRGHGTGAGQGGTGPAAAPAWHWHTVWYSTSRFISHISSNQYFSAVSALRSSLGWLPSCGACVVVHCQKRFLELEPFQERFFRCQRWNDWFDSGSRWEWLSAVCLPLGRAEAVNNAVYATEHFVNCWTSVPAATHPHRLLRSYYRVS